MNECTYRQKSTVRKIAAIAKPAKDPTQMPMASRNHSRRHSGHPATARDVARREANIPTATQRIALDAMTATHRPPPLVTGKPKIGSVGHDTIDKTKPTTPRRVDCDPHSRTRPTRPLAAIGTSAANGPSRAIVRALSSMPSGTALVDGAVLDPEFDCEPGRSAGSRRGGADDCRDDGDVDRDGGGFWAPGPMRDLLVRDIGTNLVARVVADRRSRAARTA